MKDNSKKWRKVKNQKPIQASFPTQKVGFMDILREFYAFERIKAFITDMFMIYTPILYVVAYLILGGAESFRGNQLGIFICVFLYGIVSAAFICISSQTPGLRYMRLKITRSNDDKKVGFFRALMRFFCWLVGVTFLIGLFTPFFRKDRKLLHDILCDTDIVPITPREFPKPIQ